MPSAVVGSGSGSGSGGGGVGHVGHVDTDSRAEAGGADHVLSHPSLSFLKVTVSGGLRGVYLRQLSDVSKKTQWAVTVKPVLHEDEHNDKRVGTARAGVT